MDGFYTVKEVCLKLHIARETLRRWEHDDWFPKRTRFRGTLGADGQHGILLPARGLDSPDVWRQRSATKGQAGPPIWARPNAIQNDIGGRVR
jgi:hypothetical protein